VVLTGHFGGLLVRGIYDYIIDCLKRENEVPVAMKLYPKTVLSLLALSAFLCAYSPQTAMFLVQKNFADEKYAGIRNILYNCAKYGISGFSFINLFQIILAGSLLFAHEYGTDDEKLAVEIGLVGERMVEAVASLDGQKFEEALTEMSPDHRKVVLGISDDNEFQRLKNHEANLQQKLIENSQKVRCCRSCFLPAPKSELSSIISINLPAKLSL
jgi:hypothetical protein